MKIEWGRAKRGKVWHMLLPEQEVVDGETRGTVQSTLCDLDHVIVEVTEGEPPKRATPCPRCGEVVEDLSFAFLRARSVASDSTPGTLAYPRQEAGLGLDSE